MEYVFEVLILSFMILLGVAIPFLLTLTPESAEKIQNYLSLKLNMFNSIFSYDKARNEFLDDALESLKDKKNLNYVSVGKADGIDSIYINDYRISTTIDNNFGVEVSSLGNEKSKRPSRRTRKKLLKFLKTYDDYQIRINKKNKKYPLLSDTINEKYNNPEKYI